MVHTNAYLRKLGEGVNRRSKELKYLIEWAIRDILIEAEGGKTSCEVSALSEFWDYDFIQEYFAGVRKEFPEMWIIEERGGSNPNVKYFTFSWE